MAQDKLLAEWFWTDRWMGSSAFLLPIHARGLYREMLTQSWRRGAKLPSDFEMIRRAVGVTLAEWDAGWPMISHFWHLDANKNLVNDTQIAVYAEAKMRQTENENRARNAAEARWNKSSSNAQASTQALPDIELKQCPPSPSPSPSLNQSPELNPILDLNNKLVTSARPSTTSGNGTNGAHYQKTPIIGRSTHLRHVACDDSMSYCVPDTVQNKLADLLAPKHDGDREAAKAALQKWYPVIWKDIPKGTVMGDAFTFWQRHFDNSFASKPKKVSQLDVALKSIQDKAKAAR